MDIRFYGFYEGFKDSRPEVLFYGILLGSVYIILLGSLVVSSVGASVGYYEGFKYGKLDGTLVGN